MKILKFIFFTLMGAITFFSIYCFVYPTISNLINEYFNESRINEYNSNVDTTSKEEIQSYFFEAEKYNRVIATDFFNNKDKITYSEILNDYYNILNIDNGLMGYVEIPSIDVKLPIYHGESEDVLKKGAAHLEQTSFPIGGTDTHACISAHSGYPSQKFFDDIDELNEDDLIYIQILNRRICYKVYGKEVIEPSDTSKLGVETGKDLLTLITCYPYGINSHRLLVHAKRIENTDNTSATADEVIKNDISKRNPSIFIIGSVIAVFAFLFVIQIIKHLRKKN